MKPTREQYIDLIGRWLHGSNGYIRRLDVDREYDKEIDVVNIWVGESIVSNLHEIKSIEDNKVQFGHELWVDLNDDRKELSRFNESCANCASQCKREEICSFFDEAHSSHNYNEVHGFKLNRKKQYREDDLIYWWDVPNE